MLLYMLAQHWSLSHCVRQVMLFELASSEKVAGKVVPSTTVVALKCCVSFLLPDIPCCGSGECVGLCQIW